jgi:hypothetical protein
MQSDSYQYVLSLFRNDGHALGHFSLSADFDPAVECTLFRGVRRDELPPSMPDAPATSIEPVWNHKAGEPYTSGFRVRAAVDGRQTVHEFGIAYFADLAHAASEKYVESGELKAGETFSYLISAYPRRPEQRTESVARFTVKSRIPPLVLKEGSEIQRFLRESVRCGPDGEADSEDSRVFIPQHVLDEASELTRAAGANETGGILIGHLHRGVETGDVFLEVTAQIPAHYVDAALTRLTFTAETWTAVQAAIDLRRSGEIMAGWWHSHSFLKESCKDCEKLKEKSCTTSAAFMSSADRALHRTVFPRAYSIALVMSDSPCSGLTWRLFGWRNGRIEARDFHILGGQPAITRDEGKENVASLEMQETHHA